MLCFLAIDLLNLSPTEMWFWLTIIFLIIEIFTIYMFSIWFMLGALAALLVSYVTDSLLIQSAVFLLVSALTLWRTRPFAIKVLKVGQHKTNVDELIGASCVVFTEIKPHDVGEVKLKGKVWRATSESNKEYAVGDLANVLRIEGVTIIIQ